MRSPEEQRAYQRGYNNGRSGNWPMALEIHAKIPDEAVRRLAFSAKALRDAVDVYFSCMLPEELQDGFGLAIADAWDRTDDALLALQPRLTTDA